jgi:hypothetical protein
VLVGVLGFRVLWVRSAIVPSQLERFGVKSCIDTSILQSRLRFWPFLVEATLEYRIRAFGEESRKTIAWSSRGGLEVSADDELGIRRDGYIRNPRAEEWLVVTRVARTGSGKLRNSIKTLPGRLPTKQTRNQDLAVSLLLNSFHRGVANGARGQVLNFEFVPSVMHSLDQARY